MRDIIKMVGIYVVVVFALFGVMLAVTGKRKTSPYLLFAISDLICGLPVIGVAMFDILTPGGDLNGLFGTLLLMIYVPTVIVLLLIDIVAWLTVKKKRVTESTER